MFSIPQIKILRQTQEKNHAQVHREKPEFKAGPFSETKKEPKCPSADEQIKKMWLHTYDRMLLSHKE